MQNLRRSVPNWRHKEDSIRGGAYNFSSDNRGFALRIFPA